MTQRKLQTEVEQLRASNFRLSSTVQELRLEICYYQGETKKLEWEKNLLKQEVSKMSAFVKKSHAELIQSSHRKIIDDPQYLTTLVKNPCRHICDILQLSSQRIIVTSSEAPFFVEVIYIVAVMD